MKVSRHTQRRFLTALLLTVVYLLMTLSPLAPLALRSPHLAHAITGECVGDCDICGCSPEQRANHTCCCAQKKKLDQHEKTRECCKPKGAEATPVLKCSCPCGSAKQVTLLNFAKSEAIPFSFTPSLATPFSASPPAAAPSQPVSRWAEPPEPPPRLLAS